MGEVCVVHSWDEAARMIYESKFQAGVMVTGNSCNAKDRFVYSTLERKFGTVICLTLASCSPERLKRAFEDSRVVCASLTPEDSCSQTKRRNAIAALRNAGARTVYGVYLYEIDSMLPKDQSPGLDLKIANTEKFDKLIIAIEQRP